MAKKSVSTSTQRMPVLPSTSKPKKSTPAAPARETKGLPINKDDLPENQPGHPNFNKLYGLDLGERAALKKERKAELRERDARKDRVTRKGRESKKLKQGLGDW
ncbi:uncharacterized protein LAJ45_04190 [Morchella importuna]|uniref:uncharacterized protein n=1 Tax=Morchella importuna TaxID=1174673 RepID=UPI001E8E022A|nr:uncharacterized protein LAJ45_04190 [Morchella importuna]KAH8151569.1 hypothetical protein LAJ45_04190 [Morchella importuna]